jgi:hypothetical protein
MTGPSFDQQDRLLCELRELIAALEKRVPQPQRDSERHIATDSARLEQRARTRIAAIEKRLASTRCEETRATNGRVTG